ncbi:MAG: hypothetical protein OK438_04925 [Thaumarchaeota archaeon]|nr:hypothetical protein [Nitrososphaerota archaeon]
MELSRSGQLILVLIAVSISLGGALTYVIQNTTATIENQNEAIAILDGQAARTLTLWGCEPGSCYGNSICPLLLGCVMLEGVPDSFDYHDNWVSNHPITVYYIDIPSLASCGPYNNSSAWIDCVGTHAVKQFTGSKGGDTFTLSEGCGGYVAIYYLTAGENITPDISVTFDPSFVGTGVCAASPVP